MALPTEVWDQLVREVERVGSLNQACQNLRINRSTANYQIATKPEFAARIDRARALAEQELIEEITTKAKAATGFVIKEQARHPDTGEPIYEHATDQDGEYLWHDDGSPVLRKMMVERLVGHDPNIFGKLMDKKLQGQPQRVQATNLNVNRGGAPQPHDDCVEVLVVDPVTGELRPLGGDG
jgi:hypothetical protein